MPRSEALKRAQKKYQHNTNKSVVIKLHKEYDEDIIEHLETVKSKQGYIKELIRKDMYSAQDDGGYLNDPLYRNFT